MLRKFNCNAAWRVHKFYHPDNDTYMIFVLYDLLIDKDRKSYKNIAIHPDEAVLVFDKDGNIINKQREGDDYKDLVPTFYAHTKEAKANFKNTTDEEWINLVREKIK